LYIATLEAGERIQHRNYTEIKKHSETFGVLSFFYFVNWTM